MKLLIAILSCHALRHCEKAERDTWITEIPQGVDYKFFLGNPTSTLENDEVFLDVDDAFQGVTEKTVALYRWALEKGYDYTYKCDLDTLVRPQLLLRSGFEQNDYVGGYNEGFASGGSGYCLSRKALQVVVDGKYEPGPAEDWNIANALREKGILLHGDDRYVFRPGYKMNDDTISYHLSSIRQWGKVAYDPRWMYETWDDQKARKYKSYSTYTHPPFIHTPQPQVEVKNPRSLRRPPRLGLR